MAMNNLEDVIFVVWGALGIQGRAITRYLFDNTKANLCLIDIPSKVSLFKTEYTRISVTSCIPGQEYQLLRDLYWLQEPKPKRPVVVSCLSPSNNKDLYLGCVHHKIPYIDLGGDNTITSILDSWTDTDLRSPDNPNKFACIAAAGLAPGLSETLAQWFIQKHQCNNVTVYCGGLPKYPEPPHWYCNTFSSKGLIGEYTGPVSMLEDGKLVYRPALDGLEEVFIPGYGVMEAAYTSGSMSTSPEHWASSISTPYTIKYKTLRYPGHYKYIKEHVLSQPDPVEMADRIFQKGQKDIILLGAIDPNLKLKRFWKWEWDDNTGLSAMAQATGYTVGYVAEKVARGELLGFNTMRNLDFEEIIHCTGAEEINV